MDKARAAFHELLIKEADAATGLSQSDVCATLRDCLNDLFPGQYCYLRDIYGDDSAGEVVYCCGDDTFKAPYAIGNVNGKRVYSINKDSAVQVLPKTTYDTVSEAAKPKEAAKPADVTLKLFESAATLETIVLKEAKADYEIKLIAPGKGSSAFYPAEVLKRDGPKVFKAGTHVYLNHPTAAEESARPEGDVKNLAAVTSVDAVYHEAHAKGPGLYARMKVFADHAQVVEEKAAHVGMSIRASGIAESGKSKDGLPVLKELTHADSVDVVTRAGAGGMILQESATGATGTPVQQNVQEGEMTPDEVKKLVESAVQTAVAEANKPVAELRQRALRSDAREEAQRLLETVTLPSETKVRVISEAVRSLPMTDKGELDMKKFSESVVQLAQTEGAYLAKVTGSGKVFGMGPTVVTEADEKSARKAEKRALKETKRLKESGRDAFESLGMPKEAAKLAAREVA